MKTETELLTNEFKDIIVSDQPKFYDVHKLVEGGFAQRLSGLGVGKPSLLFIEKINMSESGNLAIVYWHWVNQYNGFELNTWATTFRKTESIAYERGYHWADLYTIGTARIRDARK